MTDQLRMSHFGEFLPYAAVASNVRNADEIGRTKKIPV